MLLPFFNHKEPWEPEAEIDDEMFQPLEDSDGEEESEPLAEPDQETVDETQVDQVEIADTQLDSPEPRVPIEALPAARHDEVGLATSGAVAVVPESPQDESPPPSAEYFGPPESLSDSARRTLRIELLKNLSCTKSQKYDVTISSANGILNKLLVFSVSEISTLS